MTSYDNENGRTRRLGFVAFVFTAAALLVVLAHTNGKADAKGGLLRAVDDERSKPQPHIDFGVVGFAKTGRAAIFAR